MSPEAPAPGAPRRDLLRRIFGGLGLALLAGWGAASGLALSRLPRRRRELWLDEADLRRLRDGRQIIKGSLFLRQQGDQVLALSLRCPHLGCTVRPQAQGFACPCHGSRFDARGRLLRGPATRGLERWRLSERSGRWLARPAQGDPGE